ncbi:hypothetical protein [Ralstonia pickettii]|uniref:Transmembrane protein n=1 Tax=Ralstonia pickettii TaxID=329 RepID=A0AAW4QAR7_RALPI|nr:hypothetical protein [Ralstonia pickettii]MBA9846756.1 hypothetical protein [Ralstonia pickettii]MBA9852092.1 hypothetical protein [Ralstonia pickettii]MBA9919893.1 hypothetical protein [Ralstonia pickettii]MBA9958995.1 hypothetical protein [Ralstonia pickettii]MBA9964626.1 hypothetical protein [Ralstonia pickettii]
MNERKRRILERAASAAEVLIFLSAAVTGWMVFFGQDEMLGFFLFPSFLYCLVCALYVVLSRLAMTILRSRYPHH